jgi:hypothetical protein
MGRCRARPNVRVGSGAGAHSRDQFAYDRKPLKADVISLRRLVLPRMLPVLTTEESEHAQQ